MTCRKSELGNCLEDMCGKGEQRDRVTWVTEQEEREEHMELREAFCCCLNVRNVQNVDMLIKMSQQRENKVNAAGEKGHGCRSDVGE